MSDDTVDLGSSPRYRPGRGGPGTELPTAEKLLREFESETCLCIQHPRVSRYVSLKDGQIAKVCRDSYGRGDHRTPSPDF